MYAKVMVTQILHGSSDIQDQAFESGCDMKLDLVLDTALAPCIAQSKHDMIKVSDFHLLFVLGLDDVGYNLK